MNFIILIKQLKIIFSNLTYHNKYYRGAGSFNLSLQFGKINFLNFTNNKKP